METPITQIPSTCLDQKKDNFLTDDSFQNLPSLLLKDLSRENAQNKSVLKHIDIAVYLLLKAHARFKGECHPSLERLAKLAACSVSTIQRSMKRLDDAGHIQRKNNFNGKIFLLTDVAKDGRILRRTRINFTPAPHNPRFTNPPPIIQDMVAATSSLGVANEYGIPAEDEEPF
jgi:DNA-binding transcriptional regulator YhcF (GntR family)